MANILIRSKCRFGYDQGVFGGTYPDNRVLRDPRLTGYWSHDQRELSGDIQESKH